MKLSKIMPLLLAFALAACGTSAQESASRADSAVSSASVGAVETSQRAAEAEGAAADDTEQEKNDSVASASEMIEVEEVVEEGMTPIAGEEIVDGSYDVTVDSSSSMFRVEACELTVKEGAMTAVMTMGGKGYLYLYMGTGEEAAEAAEDTYIPFEEDGDVHRFTVPVEALDQGIPCAAFSKKKEKWYDRTLVFRADSLPMDAFRNKRDTTASDLGLADGTYHAEVTLEGGSGRASVESPATFTIRDGVCTARLVWSSPHYDYMRIGEEKYLPVNEEGNSVFEIPVPSFDLRFPVIADTTAMSEPHEIEYFLTFDSSSIQEG